MDPDYFSRHSERPALDFIGNQIVAADLTTTPPLSFASPFDIKIVNLHFIHPISCEQVDAIKGQPFFEQHAAAIFFHLNDAAEAAKSFSVITQSICVPRSYLAYIVAGVGALVLVLCVAVVVLVVLFVRKRRAARALNVVQPDGRTYRETQIVMQIENAGLLKTDL